MALVAVGAFQHAVIIRVKGEQENGGGGLEFSVASGAGEPYASGIFQGRNKNDEQNRAKEDQNDPPRNLVERVSEAELTGGKKRNEDKE